MTFSVSITDGMMPKTVLITGTPRSGTTLTCHLLNKLPNTVALHEPMRSRDMRHPQGVCAAVAEFCAGQRASILRQGLAMTKHADGAVPANPIGTNRTAQGYRERVVAKGEIAVDKELDADFVLAVKHCGSFTATLDRLVTAFPVYALVRNPLATLASWNSVDFPIRNGRIPNAEGLDPDLAANLDRLDSVLDRQLFLLDWFHARLRRHLPPEAIIRYEQLVATGGRALAVIQPVASTLAEPLDSQNLSIQYDREQMLEWGDRLLASDGAYWDSYARSEVEALLGDLRALPAAR